MVETFCMILKVKTLSFYCIFPKNKNNFLRHFDVVFKLTPIYDVEGCKVATDALDSKKESDLKSFMASVPVNAPKSAPKPSAKNQWKNSTKKILKMWRILSHFI